MVVALAACAGSPDDAPATRAFYYWRTRFHLSAAEQRALADAHVDRLYIRLFDLDWRDQPTVLGAITPIGGLFFLAGWACLAFAAI